MRGKHSTWCSVAPIPVSWFLGCSSQPALWRQRLQLRLQRLLLSVSCFLPGGGVVLIFRVIVFLFPLLLLNWFFIPGCIHVYLRGRRDCLWVVRLVTVLLMQLCVPASSRRLCYDKDLWPANEQVCYWSHFALRQVILMPRGTKFLKDSISCTGKADFPFSTIVLNLPKVLSWGIIQLSVVGEHHSLTRTATTLLGKITMVPGVHCCFSLPIRNGFSWPLYQEKMIFSFSLLFWIGYVLKF